jgi:hypothetical protein
MTRRPKFMGLPSRLDPTPRSSAPRALTRVSRRWTVRCGRRRASAPRATRLRGERAPDPDISRHGEDATSPAAAVLEVSDDMVVGSRELGFADLHMHQFGHMAFGGHFIWGLPSGPLPNGLLDVVGDVSRNWNEGDRALRLPGSPHKQSGLDAAFPPAIHRADGQGRGDRRRPHSSVPRAICRGQSAGLGRP